MFVSEIASDKVIIRTPAKINLFLEVLNRRNYGFHNINSFFQAVSLFDFLEFTLISPNNLTIEIINNRKLPVGDDNLITKAFKLLKDAFGLKKGLNVKLGKNIPIAAGLGGGSADASATILACNLLFNLRLTYSQMAKLGLEIGSDLPFFFSSGCALVSGKGEVVDNQAFPNNYYLVLVNPGIGISTLESYRRLKRDLTISKNPYKLAPCRTMKKFIESLKIAGNDFEKVHFESYPELIRIKDGLLKSGALMARMSGSGPTMFGIYSKPPEIKDDIMMAGENWQMYAVEPIFLPRRV
ncbi:MAG: 4-(cytidine 5'-diphospho)-2-C-methyl-D-erythritol kinase [Candidatus Zixiibacteriota bacterium]